MGAHDDDENDGHHHQHHHDGQQIRLDVKLIGTSLSAGLWRPEFVSSGVARTKIKFQ